jgi:hypothetical protein
VSAPRAGDLPNRVFRPGRISGDTRSHRSRPPFCVDPWLIPARAGLWIQRH